ncbi:hypothetical protein BC628DRAFT_1136751 [Trametes gibbosa]|nr:hypothetical protein BC628DRAFT_1136751 [Trametes gibbosa]
MSSTLSTVSPLATPVLTSRSLATQLPAGGETSRSETARFVTPLDLTGGQDESKQEVAGWGFWSALASPPKFRSGTLIFDHVPKRLLARANDPSQLRRDSRVLCLLPMVVSRDPLTAVRVLFARPYQNGFKNVVRAVRPTYNRGKQSSFEKILKTSLVDSSFCPRAMC